MHEHKPEQRESISALVDGQLGGVALTHTVAWLASSAEARATWHAYHVVGDVLRCPDLADCGRDQVFLDRFRERLVQANSTNAVGQEPAPARLPVHESVRLVSVGAVEAVVSPQRALQAANDAAVRWQWLAAVASFTAVAVLGWHVGTVKPSQLAAAPYDASSSVASTATADVESPTMLRDPRLDELLAAHRQFGGTSALQVPTGFLRNATFEPSAR